MYKLKSILSLPLILLVLFLTTPNAFAEDIPVLTWERGQVQNIVLGQGENSGSWEVYLKSLDGKKLSAAKSLANEDNFLVYTISIPQNFPTEGYVVEAVNQNGEIKQVAGIQIVESISKEITRAPLELFLILLGISFFFYLINFSKARRITLNDFQVTATSRNNPQILVQSKIQIELQKNSDPSLLRTLFLEELKIDFKFASVVNFFGLAGITFISLLQFSEQNWILANSVLVMVILLLGNLSVTYGLLMMSLSILFSVLNISLTKTFAEILTILVISSILILPNIYNQFLFKILNQVNLQILKINFVSILSAAIAALSAYQLLLIFESLTPTKGFSGFSKELLAISLLLVFSAKNYLILNKDESVEIFEIVRSISPIYSILLGTLIASIVYIWTTNLVIFFVSLLSTILILSSNWLRLDFSEKLRFKQTSPITTLVLILVVTLSFYFSISVLPLDVINRSHLGLLLIFPLDLFLAIYLMFAKPWNAEVEKI